MNGQKFYKPISEIEAEKSQKAAEKAEAQALFTALMTDTLLDESEEL